MSYSFMYCFVYLFLNFLFSKFCSTIVLRNLSVLQFTKHTESGNIEGPCKDRMPNTGCNKDGLENCLTLLCAWRKCKVSSEYVCKNITRYTNMKWSPAKCQILVNEKAFGSWHIMKNITKYYNFNAPFKILLSLATLSH